MAAPGVPRNGIRVRRGVSFFFSSSWSRDSQRPLDPLVSFSFFATSIMLLASERRPLKVRRRRPTHPRHLIVRVIVPQSLRLPLSLSRPRLCHSRNSSLCLWKRPVNLFGLSGRVHAPLRLPNSLRKITPKWSLTPALVRGHGKLATKLLAPKPGRGFLMGRLRPMCAVFLVVPRWPLRGSEKPERRSHLRRAKWATAMVASSCRCSTQRAEPKPRAACAHRPFYH